MAQGYPSLPFSFFVIHGDIGSSRHSQFLPEESPSAPPFNWHYRLGKKDKTFRFGELNPENALLLFKEQLYSGMTSVLGSCVKIL